MSVLIYLGGSCLHLSLDNLVLAVRKLQGEGGMGCIQSIKSGEIPGSIHCGTN